MARSGAALSRQSVEASGSPEGREVRNARQRSRKSLFGSSPPTLTVSYETLLLPKNATYNSLVQAEQQLQSGETGAEVAHSLIDVSKDVLALALESMH